MEPFIVVAFVAFALFALGKSRTENDTFAAALRDVGRDFESEIDPGGFFRWPRLLGLQRGHGVLVELRNIDDEVHTAVVVSATLPAGLSIGREGMVSGIRRFLGDGDIEVGIDGFDGAYQLRAAEDGDVLTRLGARTRAAIEEVVGGSGATVADGAITIVTKGKETSPVALRLRVGAALELADALTDHTGNAPEMLLRRAIEEPDEDVGFRRTCLEALLRDHPKSSFAARGAEQAAAEPDPVLRFLAACHQGDAGRPVLRALLRDGLLEGDHAAEARALLGPEGAGGLALAAEDPAAGGLSLDQRAARGALSKAKTKG